MGELHGLGSIRAALRAYEPRLLVGAGQQRAAVALLLRPLEHDVELFFIKRAEHPKDPWSGHMALPGGRVDAQDGSPLAAAIRETREEVDIELERGARFLGSLDEIGAVARGRRVPLSIMPFVFELLEEVTPRGNDEVEELHWIAGSTLRDPEVLSTLEYDFEGQRYELPCFRIAGRVIWGLTYRMLAVFFSAVGWPALPRHPSPIRG